MSTAIAAELGLDRMATWGHSGGGPYALACAALLPGLVVAACVFASPGPVDGPGLDFTAGWSEGDREEFELYFAQPELARELRWSRAQERLPALSTTDGWLDLSGESPSTASAQTLELARYLALVRQDALCRGDQGWWDDNVALLSPRGFDPVGIGVPVQLGTASRTRLCRPRTVTGWRAASLPSRRTSRTATTTAASTTGTSRRHTAGCGGWPDRGPAVHRDAAGVGRAALAGISSPGCDSLLRPAIRRPAATVGRVSGTATAPRDAGALATAIDVGLAGAGVPGLTAGMQRLMAAYRSGATPAAPVLATRADAAAYAAYRMPATVAAMSLVLRQTRLSLPAWQPATLLDFGAGTGSVAWAAADELASIRAVTLLEQSAEAIRLGRAILRSTGLPVLRAATWRSWQLPAAGGSQPGDRAAADLATASYVLGELTEPQQAALVALAVRAAPAVVLVEPGTPAGHQRILAAREQLLTAGYLLAAPCPHQLPCPLAAAGDWCHFAARLPRSPVHRHVKGADLGYEDEKFSYVAAVRPALLGPADARPGRPPGRIVRRPQQRKALMTLEVCWRDGTATRELIGKSRGAAYRRARKSSWGDRWDASFVPD